MPRHLRALLIGSALYGVALAVIALWPTHVDSGIDVVYGTFFGRWLLAQGLSPRTTYDLIQFSANILLYVPLGILTMMVARRTRWWHAVALALVVSSTFEVLQAVLRPGRTADVTDVIANTLGAAVGATIFVVSRAVVQPRGAHTPGGR